MYFQTSLSSANNLVYLWNIMIWYFIHQSMADICETYNHLRGSGAQWFTKSRAIPSLYCHNFITVVLKEANGSKVGPQTVRNTLAHKHLTHRIARKPSPLPTPLYRHSAPPVPSSATTSSSKAFQILQSPSAESSWRCTECDFVRLHLGGAWWQGCNTIDSLTSAVRSWCQTAGDTMRSCYPLSGGHLGPCLQASPSGIVFKTDRPSNERSCLTIYCSSKPAIYISSDALLKEQFSLKLTICHNLLTLMSLQIFLKFWPLISI